MVRSAHAVTALKHRCANAGGMDQAPASFDWIGWLSTVPGIPADWGQPISRLAEPAVEPTVPEPEQRLAA